MARKPIDLDVLRQGRAVLERLVAEHPELTSPESQARLGTVLDELDLDAAGELDTPEPPEPPKDPPRMPVAATVNARPAVNIRLEPGLVDALDAAARAIPALSRHALARAALFIGLAAIVADPALALGQPVGARQPMPTKPKAPRARRSKR